MKIEDIEALDLKPNQRIELTMNTSIGYHLQPLPDNETFTQMVYYQGITQSEHGTRKLNFYLSTGYKWDAKTPVVDSVLVDLIEKISHLEVL